MALLEGRTPAERNKLIAAAVLGLVALIALYFAFGRSGGSSTSAKPNASPTPTPKTTTSTRTDQAMPTMTEQDFVYQTTPVSYSGSTFAPDPGRNIFAFYEPAPPCRNNCPPTPVPPVIVKTPTPAPTPIILATFLNPQAVYAGARGFRLEVNGDKIPADARIYFNQTEVPTTYINGQRVVTDIPANMIAQEGPRQIILQTPNGKIYSNPLMLSVQAPPRPTVIYIGMIGRKRYNNDTAYFTETEKSVPFGARLNDVVGGRFRLIDIEATEVIFEDVSLGFRHRVPITKGTGSGTGGVPNKGGGVPDGGMMVPVPYDPGMQKDIPGIPNNIPRYVPQPAQPSTKEDQKKDVDDDG